MPPKIYAKKSSGSVVEVGFSTGASTSQIIPQANVNEIVAHRFNISKLYDLNNMFANANIKILAR